VRVDTEAQIYHHAAEALAHMKLPTFSDLDRTEVIRAFNAAFKADNFLEPDATWLDNFARDVSFISAGHVALRAATDDELPSFDPRPKGPTGYLILTSGNDKLNLVLVPSFPPFQTRG
jgi:hypothetical protein